jgi:hypothetical protein
MHTECTARSVSRLLCLRRHPSFLSTGRSSVGETGVSRPGWSPLSIKSCGGFVIEETGENSIYASRRIPHEVHGSRSEMLRTNGHPAAPFSRRITSSGSGVLCSSA